jgi:hypothetical protein
MAGVDEIEDAHAGLAGMLAVQAAGLLLQRALPGNRHGQHQRVQRDPDGIRHRLRTRIGRVLRGEISRRVTWPFRTT